MVPSLFRILSTLWAVCVASYYVLQLRDPTLVSIAGVAFWAVYLLASLGTLIDLRMAWLTCLVQLAAVWVMMGMAVSKENFVFFTGRPLNVDSPHVVYALVFESFFGILVPCSTLLILAILCRRHLVWVFSRRRRASLRRPPRRRAAR